MDAAPPLHRRIMTLSDVRVELSQDGKSLKSATVRLTVATGWDLHGAIDLLTSNCSANVLDQLEAALEINETNSSPVKFGIFIAILWWERWWTCDSDWELEDGPDHWDPPVLELLHRLFL